MTSERKPGRRPGDPEVTKRAILEAARAVFSESGFDRATIRAMAARAGVDPALVHHHFGTKQDLFARAHELPTNPAELISTAAATPRDQMGEAVVRVYLEVVGVPGSPLLSLIRAAATTESATRMLQEYIEEVLLENADKLIPYPDAKLRMALLGSTMIGIVFARSLLELEPIAEAPTEELVSILAPIADRYLNSPDLTAP